MKMKSKSKVMVYSSGVNTNIKIGKEGQKTGFLNYAKNNGKKK